MTALDSARLNDAHCHFFSAGFFTALAQDPAAPRAADPAVALPEALGWDPPGDPSQLADRWVAELDRHGVGRAALMASVPGDEASVAAAVARHPSRFAGLFMVNPTAPGTEEGVRRGFGEHGLRCACLFPAMHRFALDDECVTAVFRAAADHGCAIFVHCGVLSVGVRRKLGLASRFDVRLGDPLAVARVASAFPSVPVIVPHFGAGFLRETLMAADLAANIHVDTSSSNGWMKYTPGSSLTDVFRRALAVLGPERILFGSDSSFFPRGWQRPVHEAQCAVLDAIDLDPEGRAAILADNFDRVFGTAGTLSPRTD
ncbi:MAG: amidohydrolase family protein [Acidobacteria bacterium]|nr:amidohydrolase family protein [Acidobacteriota bacterium]